MIQGRDKRRRGSALIMVMGVLVLLSIVGTAFVVFMRIETHATRNFNEDAEARMLALQALNYALAHPTWNPPADSNPINNDVDNDNNNVKDSKWFTYPLCELASDTHARFAILKKTFTGRVDINWDGFYNNYPLNDPVPFDNVHQAVNEGASTSEISLERIFERYIKEQIALGAAGFVGVDPNQAGSVARELALRICNYRYAAEDDLAPTDTGTSTHRQPGADGNDDTDFCDSFRYNSNDLNRIGAAPDNRTYEDDAAWVYPNWRPDPARDWVNELADGYFDRTNGAIPPSPVEQIDKPQDFLQFPADNSTLGAAWVAPGRNNDDNPFKTSALNSILTNSGSDLRDMVNDVFNTWAAANGINGYDPAVDYFGSYIRNILTTSNRDYIGKQTPINHLNILPPDAGDPDYDAHMLVVQADRGKFIAAMTETMTDGGMTRDAAINTSWQILANFIDYLDEDGDITCLVKPQGWLDDATHDLNSNHRPDAGEPGTRAFYGTERQPYINELWVYNRGSDHFDNDGVNGSDASIPTPDPGEIDRNGYFIELYNHYDNTAHDPIVLYHDNPGGELVNWGIRITNSAGAQQGSIHYFWDAVTPAQIWSSGAWTNLAPGTDLVIPAGGYLIIENHDYKAENVQIAASAPGSRLLPDPALTWPAPGALSPGGPGNSPQAVLVNLNLSASLKLWQPGDRVELVYKRDPRVAGTPAAEVVVDRQETPTDMTDACPYVDPAGVTHTGYATLGPYHFWPSFEREDPRLARAITDNSQRLIPTWAFRNAAEGTGGGKIRTTVGRVNDNGDIAADGSWLDDSNVYDGNYRLGDETWLASEMLSTYVPPAGTAKKFRFDDLVEIPNSVTYKFANVGSLGNLLCVGPMPPDPAAFGWATTDWLVENSPYTWVKQDSSTAYPANPLDSKKIDFTIVPDSGAASNPRGRFRAVFDKFTTFCPWKDGRDNNGDWVRATDDVNDAFGDDTHAGDGGPSVGDQHVDEGSEAYVYGRIDVNSVNDSAEGLAVLSGLPYVNTDTTFYRDPTGSPATLDVTRAFLHPQKILDKRPAGGYLTRKDFLERVLIDVPGAYADGALDITNAYYDPNNAAAPVGAFGRDSEDNNIWQFGATPRRRDPAHAYEWDTLQRYPRTNFTISSMVDQQFNIEGIDTPTATNNGGDFSDEKSETDYTVGALMNAISLHSELPEGFTSNDLGPVTYYVTVDITNGKDVDGQMAVGGPAAAPQWTDTDVQVLAEKKIIALVDTRLPLTDPKRVTIFNWSVEGRSPAK